MAEDYHPDTRAIKEESSALLCESLCGPLGWYLFVAFASIAKTDS
jgi:hypothetical protein